MTKDSFEKAYELFRQNNGLLRTSQAKKLGINEATIMLMEEEGILLKEGRGLYRLADYPPLSNPDFVQVSTRIPNSVICLISALNFHKLTTQIPHKVFVALPRGTKRPQIDYPPLEFIWPIERIYSAGIDDHVIDGVPIKIYNKEKTIADCFRYRSKVSLSIAIESLKDYMNTPKPDLDTLINYATIDRVDKIIIPYIKAIA